ncbi:hypothetical protein LCGC14_0549290 [marine sediment metagenome]|uniref:Large polyvalent protein associated domain-containing protein n=1 Tax=marine sediment metagenome TaxID=412755 RepID=A0A0F9RQK1_9ZZZZ
MPLTDFQGINPLGREVAATDRPGLALQNAFAGDLPGAWRSMFQPKELTKGERNVLLKKWGLDSGPYAQVFRTLTNPVLILALAVSHKFPVPAGNNIFKLSKTVQGLAAKFPILRKIASMQGLFQGMKRSGATADFVDEFGAIIRDVNDFRGKHGESFAGHLERFRRNTGHLPSLKEQRIVASWLDGLHMPLRGFQGKHGTIRIGSGETTAVVESIGTLMPNLEQKMGGALHQLGRGFRETLDAQWQEVFVSLGPKGRKRILSAIQKQKSVGITDDISESMAAFIRDPNKIPFFFPRRLLQSEEDFRRLISVLTESTSSKKFAGSAKRKISAWASPEVYKRKFQMLPSSQDLDAMGDLVDPVARSRLDTLMRSRLVDKARVAGVRGSTLATMKKLPLRELEKNYPTLFQPAEAQKIAGLLAEHSPREYSLKLMPVISQYNHTLAGTFAWTVKGGGEKAVQMLDDLKIRGKVDAVARYQASILEETYIPIAMGRGTLRNTMRSQLWSQATQQLAVKIETSPGMRKILGDKATDMLIGGMRSSKGAFSLLNLERKAAGYFYLSTLGLNPGSALKNTLQLVLTTGPMIGYKTAAAGLGEAMRKSHKYFALRLGPRRIGHEAALRKAYPEFAKTGLVASPITEEAIQNSLINAYEIAALPSAGVKVADKIQRGMMSMFTASETTVRLATFEAGMLHARRAKMPIEASIEFSRKLVEKTQFLTGPQNTPFFLLDRSPLTRQLAQFPLRMLEFVTTTAFSLGSGAINPKTGKEMNLLGFNPGTFARMVAGSVLAMELGEAMNLNMGDALLGGALPTFQPAGKVLAPIPIVPPFFQILGAGAIGLGSGDFTELMRSTPLVIPGGVSAFRIMGLVPPGVPGAKLGQAMAKTFERTYADYSQPAPDGRVAVFSGRGTLKGFYRPWELVRYGMGVKGGDLEKESRLLETLVKNRDTIREERRSYMDARFVNNAKGAAQIAEGFAKRFGFPLPVSEKDMKAMQLRRQMTRLEQVVRTMPPGPAREQIIELIGATLGTTGEQVLGIDPALLGETSKVRQAARTANVGRTNFNARTNLSPLDTVDPNTIGRQRGVNRQQPPF